MQRSSRRFRCVVLAGVAAVAVSWQSAQAVVSTDVGGSGVTAGNSSLIGAYDYSDTFTGTADGGSNPNRPYVPAIQPPAAYVVENTYGNPSQNFQTQGQPAGVAAFSFASDTEGRVTSSEVPVYPGSSGAGSTTGFTQTGGGGTDYGITYGLRPEYIVQVDAVQSRDRIDVTSGPLPGTIGGAGSLSVFFRGSGGGISLYNGTTDTPVPNFNTGITGPDTWHNYAVRFDQTDQQVEIYVNEVSRGIIDLTTFAGGIYANFSNAAVGAGGNNAAGGTRLWTDNFQVGAVVPEPGMAGLAGAALFGLLARRRRG